MLRVLFISFICLSWSGAERTEELINRKENSYLELHSSKKESTRILTVKKTNVCTQKWTSIPRENTKSFIQSLYNAGWESWKGTKDVTGDFQVGLVLDSFKVDKLRPKDTTYKFFFGINVFDEIGRQQKLTGSAYTTRISAVKRAIRSREYGVQVQLIRRTTIYQLRLSSYDLFGSDRSPGSERTGPHRFIYF